MTATHFILSAICIGFVNMCLEWFLIGFLFHKYQSLTPATWRAENTKSYIYSTLLSFLFGILFTIFYIIIGVKHILTENFWSDFILGLTCFACFSFIMETANAIYINYDKKFVAGKLMASLLSYLAAAIIAGLFYRL